MTRLITAFCMSVLFPMSIFAGKFSSDLPEGSAEAELIALDDAWIEAEVKGDRETLERILHEDFLATFASGKTVDRGGYIDVILGMAIEPFQVFHEAVVVHGDTALVIDISESGKTKFTWVAIKQAGHWRVISETFSSVDSPADD